MPGAPTDAQSGSRRTSTSRTARSSPMAARAAYSWMRANAPVFRDRNGLAAASTYQAVIDAERSPETFSNTGGIRPDQPGMPYMIDMDDPPHLVRRKLVNSGFTRKRVMDKAAGIEALCDTSSMPSASGGVRFRP